MRIRCGELDVYATGCIQAFEDDPIKISLNDNLKKTIICYHFLFVDDGTEKQSMQFRKTTARDFQITLINFSKSIGSGSLSPLRLGTFMGRSLFFSYRINTIQNSDEKLLFYTWYLGNVTDESTLHIEI